MQPAVVCRLAAATRIENRPIEDDERRLAGSASRDELRREIGRSLELFMQGAMRESSAGGARSIQLAGA